MHVGRRFSLRIQDGPADRVHARFDQLDVGRGLCAARHAHPGGFGAQRRTRRIRRRQADRLLIGLQLPTGNLKPGPRAYLHHVVARRKVEQAKPAEVVGVCVPDRRRIPAGTNLKRVDLNA